MAMNLNTESGAGQCADHLVNIHALIDAIFGTTPDRPSVRWLQYQMTRRTVPYYKIGNLCRFSVPMVRQALEKNCLITAGSGRMPTKTKSKPSPDGSNGKTRSVK
jgi:hypothetical protein